jgi:hypothetical protein
LRIKVSASLFVSQTGSAAISDQPFANPRQLLSQCIDPPQISSLRDAFLELLQVEALALSETASAELVEMFQGFSTTGPAMTKSKTTTKVNTDSLDSLLSHCTVTTSGSLLSQLPVGIYHGKTVVMAARLGPKFVPAALVAAAIMSAKSPFVITNPTLPNLSKLMVSSCGGKMHVDRGNLCDITATIRLLCLCVSKFHKLGTVQFHIFCEKHGLLSARGLLLLFLIRFFQAFTSLECIG